LNEQGGFLQSWHEAAVTATGLFWTAFWAFCLGYLISAMIQVFVTRKRMQETMGERGPKSIALGSFFGFISSSCSFAALSATRALFAKGAGLAPSLAFLLASTNLVVELGIIIALFLGWQFVVGEYVGGVLLILLMWLLVRLTASSGLIDEARTHAKEEQGSSDDDGPADWKQKIRSKEGWADVASRFFMEWAMVWKDVTIGFTIAGAIAVFVPRSFFETLFVGSGSDDPTFWQLLLQSLVGPVAAFFTFIGSMGNIPLAAVLYDNGVAFAGIMAFIFSDLVVIPVLRLNAKYLGWKMALYILGVFLAVLVITALTLHYGFELLGLLPKEGAAKTVTDREYFKLDYTLWLNLGFGVLLVSFFGWKVASRGVNLTTGEGVTEKVLFWFAVLSYAWLAGGLLIGIV
jgi:uncharacterized membrane protein YraQ (UPF0718 family)